MSDRAKQERSADHIWHVWINRYSGELPKEEWPHSLYEFKSMLNFLEYGHRLIQKAFDGELPKTHQQCSHQLPVPIINNVLKCAIGTSVIKCPILLSLRDTWQKQMEVVTPFNNKKPYGDLPIELLYQTMSKTCAWHMYTTAVGAAKGYYWGGIDTSEGYLMDESDRMFWSRVYESMSYDPKQDEENEDGE
jgi:hypothetical protein